MSKILWVINVVFFFYLVFVRSEIKFYRYLHQELPHEVLQLVKQAHKGEPFNTEPYIYVSADMRKMLTYPLTVEQAEMIGSTQYPVTENNFEYELVAHSYKKNVLFLTALITIDYCDTAKNIDLHFHKIQFLIKCGGTRKRDSWEILSVEYDMKK